MLRNLEEILLEQIDQIDKEEERISKYMSYPVNMIVEKNLVANVETFKLRLRRAEKSLELYNLRHGIEPYGDKPQKRLGY